VALYGALLGGIPLSELDVLYFPLAVSGALLLSFPFLILLRSLGPDNPRLAGVSIRPSVLRLWFAAAFVWVTLSPTIAAITSYGTFRNPDIYAYISDSNRIGNLGTLPPAGGLSENLYYQAFPVYLLVLHSAAQTSGMTSLDAVYLISWMFQILFWAFALLTVKRLLPVSLQNGNPILPLAIVVVAFSNVYLNSYLGGMVPSAAAQPAALMLIYLTLARRTWGNSVLFILTSAFALVHFSPILVVAAITLLTYILMRKKKDDGYPRLVRVSFAPSRIVLPVVLLVSYTALTVALIPVADYGLKVWAFVNSLVGEAVGGEAALNPGISRGLLAPLNAIAPAFLGAACISGLVLAFGRRGRYPQVARPLLAAIAIVSLTAVGLGVLRQRFAAQAYFSVARYLALPGFAFANVLALVIVTLVLSTEVDSFSNRRLRWFLVVTSILAAIGGLLDPFAFGYT